jgi:hypothetical protein
MYFLEPAIPGAITQSVFNGPTISISWAITGDLEYLSGIINDTTAPPSTFNKTLQQLPLTVTINTPHMKNKNHPILTHVFLLFGNWYTATIH